MQRGRRPILIVVILIIATTGCGHRSIVSGPCALTIADDQNRTLEPPFHVFMARHGTASVSMVGSGWRGAIDMYLRRPDDGTVVSIVGAYRAPAFNNGQHGGLALDVDGVWRITLNDSVAGCVADFSVEVLP
jgi:hypothetical protein